MGLGYSSSLGGSLERALPFLGWLLGPVRWSDPSRCAALCRILCLGRVPRLQPSRKGSGGQCGFPLLPGWLVSGSWRCWGSIRSCRWLVLGLQRCFIHPSCLSVGIHKISEHRIDPCCWPGFFLVLLFFPSCRSRRQMWLRQLPGSGTLHLASLQTAFKLLGSGRHEAVTGAQQTVMIASMRCTSNHLAVLGWMKKLICMGWLILCMF